MDVSPRRPGGHSTGWGNGVTSKLRKNCLIRPRSFETRSVRQPSRPTRKPEQFQPSWHVDPGQGRAGFADDGQVVGSTSGAELLEVERHHKFSEKNLP